MNKRTKIVCTLGPAVDDDQKVLELLQAGMDVARLNFSHGSHEEQAGRIARLRRVANANGYVVAIMLDTQGPEIRTGLLEGGEPVYMEEGAEMVFTSDPTPGTNARVHQNCATLPQNVQPGTVILADDGLIGFEVLAVEGTDIRCRVLNSGMLGQRKSLNVPGVDAGLPAITEKDKSDLMFGIEQGVDFVAASFIRDAAGVNEVRAYLDANEGAGIQIISKIECIDAVNNIDGIIEASDGIMVARGDLGVEVPAQQVPHIQKKIIRRCNERHRPVITATQMLDSMIRNPRPTRAEVGDVANAIYDGTDAVMLSGETAAGSYPVEAVSMMATIAVDSEAHMAEDARSRQNEVWVSTFGSRAVGRAAVVTAYCIGAKALVAPTVSGRTALLISNMRPRRPIYAVTPSPEVARRMKLYWGVTPVVGEVASGNMQRVVNRAQDALKDAGLLKTGDVVVMTLGDPTTSPKTVRNGVETYAPTNTMMVVEVR